MSEIRTKQLLNTLDQFGLNPKEWSLKEQFKFDTTLDNKTVLSTVLLVNKKDPEFRLLGHAIKNSWKRVRLLSI